MLEVVKELIGVVINTGMAIYIIAFLLSKEEELLKVKNIFYFILLVVVVYINILVCPTNLRIFISTIILSIFSKQMFSEDLFKAFCSAGIEQFVLLISEILYMIVMALITGSKAEALVNTLFGTALSNLMISMIAWMLSRRHIVKQTYAKLINLRHNISPKKVMIFIGIMILIVNPVLISSYFKASVGMLLMINGSFITLVLYLAYSMLEEKSLNIAYEIENKALIKSLNEYERVIDQHRVISHENKNQLGIIRNMLNQEDQEVKEYIDHIIKIEYEDNKALLNQTEQIPNGGLQGIIYQKLLILKEKEIPYHLHISRDIKELDFTKLDMKLTVEMCKIVGVFLDNAIEEVEQLEKKEIGIDLYKDGDALGIGISNLFRRGTDFTKIGEKNYTTKGKGHGYGLKLVKQIVQKQKRFEQQTVVGRRYFKQVLLIHNLSF